MPVAGSEEDAHKLISIAGNVNESLGEGRLEDINPKLLRHFAIGAKAILNPMAAIFGGIVGQEVVKTCSGKVHTLLQKPLLESGTLGAKCNTQMVILHLTENYGASRDPPKKQASMCTVHSFPHNIDNCLTWASSEFEGLLEKTPAEVNAYLYKPSHYASGRKNAGDAQARDNLECVLECLDKEKCETF